MKTLKENVAILKALRQKALANARRQKLRAILGQPVRVSHTYWEQVARDYQRSIDSLIHSKPSISEMNLSGFTTNFE